KGTMIAVNLIANTDLKTVDEFQQLVIQQRNGAIVRLGDVADINLGAESYEEDVRFSGQKATFMGVWPLPTANTLDVVRAIRDVLPEIQSRLPSGMNASVAYDSTVYIDSAIHDVLKTLLETLLIVIVVIFLFMGSPRSVLIPVMAIPISLIGAVFLMMAAGFTINLLTLLAIVLAVGLVVDDAIVVVENVERHLQEGLTPFQAAITGARELVGPIISMTITLAAVYTPIGIQGGLTGALFREFAFTLAGAVIVSGIVALTLSPMMASKLLRPGDAEKGYAGWINRRFDWLRGAYSRALEVTVSHRVPVIIFAGLMALLIYPLSMFSVNELAPNEDQGFLFGIVQAPANATLDQVTLYTDEINKAFMSAPEVANTFQINSAAGGFGGLVTKPWNERTRSTAQIQNDLFPKTGAIAGLRVIPITPAPLPGGSNFPIEIVIASTAEPQELLEVANKLVDKAFASGLFMFADTDLKYDQPQTEIVFDRDKVAAQGLNLQRVGADLGALLGGNYVNRFNTSGRSYKVIPQIKRTERLNADQLKNMYVSGPDGRMVQLSTFARLKNSVVARELKRFQQLNSATIQGAIPPGVSKDMALRALEDEARKIMPPGFSIDYAGESRQLRTEGNTLVATMMLSAVLIFLVLAAQFESFRDPFIILLGSVPLALTGALMFTFVGFTSLNIYSQVGLITLVGLVSKNGILIVQFANQLQEEGFEKFRAIIRASATRLRPILMTTAATVMGHLPLIFASGPGAAARNSIGYVLVTGMVIGTGFTLFVVPALYMVIARTHSKKDTGLARDREEKLPQLKPATA
ncbi:MAG: efflux RND transporter permease subunit, partial [Verrucomicrobiota bacterium]